MKRILLLYISEHSGHHCASLAIDHALHGIDKEVQTLNINSFHYTNPILEKVINRVYMEVIQKRPEIWDYLYDNPKVLKNTQGLREMMHKFNTGKLKTLLDEFKPDCIVCTQAFPCGMVADYKKSNKPDIPIVAVLTDYAPHSYWIYNNVDIYVVPSEGAGNKLIANGIDPTRIRPFGIPVDPGFRATHGSEKSKICDKLGLGRDKRRILIMGGTQGLGPIKEIVRLLDTSCIDMEILVATGTNKKLYESLRARSFRKKVLILPYTNNINELMRVSSLILTKPGGITTAEALAMGLPMLIINPLPGQEAMNTQFLLGEGVAVKASCPDDVPAIVKELIDNEAKLKAMRGRALSLSRPDSSLEIAKLILELAA
ncbi:MAG: glycosyltransferase [Candidatus Omnitrophota bacterium]